MQNVVPAALPVKVSVMTGMDAQLAVIPTEMAQEFFYDKQVQKFS